MYRWRKLDDRSRAEILCWRKENRRPWHSPPHRSSLHTHAWMFTAACYEHAQHIGHSVERMAGFEDALLTTVRDRSVSISAWAVMPNHYHILATTSSAPAMLTALGNSMAGFPKNGMTKSIREAGRFGVAGRRRP